MPEFTGTKDLRSYLATFWRWKALFLAFLLLVPLAAWLLERGKPNVYTARALVGVSQTTVNTSVLSGGGSFSTTNVTAIAQIVTTSPVATVAADLLNPPASASQIVGEVSATGDPTTNFLTISAVDRRPARAAAIANAFAKAISQNLQSAAISQIDSSIAGVQAQLAHLSAQDPARLPLLQQLNQLHAAKATQGSEAAILQPATAPSTPSGPHLRRTIELALLIGLLLGVGAVVLAESADRRLRTPEDLERITGLPLLAAVAPSAFSAVLDTGPEDDEAFNMLRTALMYFNVDTPLASVLVTSAGEKDGKTTIATRLALAAAQAGLEVALVDADLRRAQVSSKLELHPRVGLGAVVAGELPLSEALVNYPLTKPASDGRLMVLPAGPPPPNPSALLSAEATIRVLRALEADNDIVIIDTPAALAVSDALPLMRSVTGVVLIARMNRTTRQTIRRLQKIIDSAHGRLLGVVATGVAAGPGYEHYYPKYYSSNGDRTRRGRRRRKRAETEAPEPDVAPAQETSNGKPEAEGVTAGPASAEE